jgi:hypothetical protein
VGNTEKAEGLFQSQLRGQAPRMTVSREFHRLLERGGRLPDVGEVGPDETGALLIDLAFASLAVAVGEALERG